MSENETLKEIHRRSEEMDYIRKMIMSLSERERQVLEFIEQGLTHKEIAAKLGLSYSTVLNYAEQVHTKLGTRNQIAAVNMLKRYKDSQES